MLSIVGLFRGLGIINSKFVGSPDHSTTPYCAAYTIFLNSFASSGMPALLPLTLDRVIAITLPLRHNSFVTKRTSVVMFVVNWSPIFALLFYDTVAYTTGSITIEYYDKYHRCVISGRNNYIEQVCLIFVPFLLILLMYGIMLFIIVRKRRRCGWFLLTSTGIIATSLLAYSPSVIANTWDVPLSYEVSQILTVTVYYINGIVNPIIYVLTHPVTRKYVMTANIWGFGVRKRNSNVVVLERSSCLVVDTVCLPNTNTQI